MPRPAAPTRLYQRPDTGEWVIRDGPKSVRTGYRGSGGRKAADAALAVYITQRDAIPDTPQPPATISVSVVLAHYLENLPAECAAPERQAYAVKALSPFWRTRTCGQVDEKTCKSYVKWRIEGDEGSGRKPAKSPTARRELGVLQAALGVAKKDKILTSLPEVTLPPKGDPRPGWLTRQQCARVLWQLWIGYRPVKNDGTLGKRTDRTKAAARWFVAALYSGCRPATVCRTTWSERPDGPWIDLEGEVWHRRGENERKTKKARRPFRASPRLLAHLRRWQRLHGGTHIVEDRSNRKRRPDRGFDFGKALATACERAGVPRCTMHTLKHTAITLFIKGGGSAEDASEYYSTSLETIQSTYWHHSPHH